MSFYVPPFDVDELAYDEALAALHGVLRLGISPMLETVIDMLAELGNPDRAFEAVQIAGTNGKTSTSRYTAAILAAHGLKVGLYTSPELVSYTERMEVDGAPVSEEAFARGITYAIEAGKRVNAKREEAGERPYDVTEFDILTVAACVAFAEAGIDVAVLECGMGGRWDATSAVGTIKSVAVTGVGLDHMHVLGDTLEAIAAEKAAIIKPGRTCVLGVGTATPASVEDVFLDQCAEAGVVPTLLLPERLEDAEGEMGEGEPREHAHFPHASYLITKRPTRIGAPLELSVATPKATYTELAALKPAYQAANIACAVVLSEQYLERELDAEALYDAIIKCPTPGRFQLLRPNPPVLIDACHNPQSVATFLTAVRAVEPDVANRPLLLCAALADKDCKGMVELLAPEFPRVACTQTTSKRALAAEELADLFREAGANVVATYSTVAEAKEALADEAYVACGSITLASELAGIFQGMSWLV